MNRERQMGKRVKQLPRITQKLPLRHHPRLRGCWPPRLDQTSVNAPMNDEDVLERVDFYPPRQLVLQTKHADLTHYRRLFTTSSALAKHLAIFLQHQLGRTIADISDAEIDF